LEFSVDDGGVLDNKGSQKTSQLIGR
jgi:hypothetical protein